MNNKQAHSDTNAKIKKISDDLGEETPVSPVSLGQKTYLTKYAHQIFLLIFVNILFIVFEIVNAFKINWISAVIYGTISISSIGYIWIQKESAKFLIPIPFISLLVASILIDFPLLITIIYGVNCLFFFIIAITKKDLQDVIITTITTGLMLIILTPLSLIDRGFIKVNNEINAISGVVLLWIICATVSTIVFRKELWQIFTYILSVQLITAVMPFIQPEGTSSNVFTIVCALGFLISAITTLVLVSKHEELDDFHILMSVIIIQIGIIILSYSFNIGHTWTSSNNNALIIDYALHIPLAIFTIANYLFNYFKVNQRQIEDGTAFAKGYDRLKPFILYLSFVISSLAMLGWVFGNLNLINVLIISILFFVVSIVINNKYLTIITMLSSYMFLSFTMSFIGSVILDIILIVLISISGALLIFAIINEKWIRGEPLTSTLTISSSLLIMIGLLILLDFASIWVSVGWVLVGFYLFAGGIFLEKILWRRVGLGIILGDIVFSIVIIAISGASGIFLGIGFMVIAIVLFGCIFLFRWSEQKQKRNLLENGEEDILEE